MRKWDRLENNHDWQLRAKFCYGGISAFVELRCAGARPRYAVKIVGLRSFYLIDAKNNVCTWSLTTAKAKAQMMAEWPWLLAKWGAINKIDEA